MAPAASLVPSQSPSCQLCPKCLWRILLPSLVVDTCPVSSFLHLAISSVLQKMTDDSEPRSVHVTLLCHPNRSLLPSYLQDQVSDTGLPFRTLHCPQKSLFKLSFSISALSPSLPVLAYAVSPPLSPPPPFYPLGFLYPRHPSQPSSELSPSPWPMREILVFRGYSSLSPCSPVLSPEPASNQRCFSTKQVRSGSSGNLFSYIKMSLSATELVLLSPNTHRWF